MEVDVVRLYVDAPSRGSIQGIWCYPPAPDDWPDYRCQSGIEQLVITDLESAKRFFREKCRWSAEAVNHIMHVVFLEQPTWRNHRAPAGALYTMT
jgi:hypothetical protein